MSPQYLGLEHLGLVVANLDHAIATWGEMLGFSVHGREELPTRGLSVAFVDTGGTRIELVAPARADSEVSAFLAKRGEGLHHVAVRVADIDATLQELVARGARLLSATPQAGAHNSRVAFVHPKSAHGVLLELVELDDGHAPAATGDRHD